MKASQTLIDHIKRSEGCRLTAYQDTAKVWTIGYGHTSGVKKGDRCSQYQAEQWLRQDLATFEQYVTKNAPRANTQGKFDALVDFTYNLGTGKYASSTLKRYIDAGRKTADIQREFLKWVYAGSVVLDGLYSRRIWEANRWNE